jgi:hypothetical protein
LARIHGELLLVVEELNLISRKRDLKGILSPKDEGAGEEGSDTEEVEELLHKLDRETGTGLQNILKYGTGGATDDFQKEFQKLLKFTWNNLKKR